MFITFEGVEGAGKSTAIRGVAASLEARGAKVLLTREPGGSGLGRELRRLLLGTSMDLDPLAELCLFLADRAQHVARIIRPALARGEIVLCDRYADSTIAYQGFARGLDVERLVTLNDIATGSLVPDLTLVLDLPVEEGLARVAARRADAGADEEGRIDAETVSFHEAVRRGFHRIAADEPGRVRLIDSRPPKETVLAACLAEIDRPGLFSA
ncbi:MAG: dTMP kinase [Desulfovibrionaceae bacterium]|nr:dTMP kinase [Desulfovibrionaceae bacterium]